MTKSTTKQIKSVAITKSQRIKKLEAQVAQQKKDLRFINRAIKVAQRIEEVDDRDKESMDIQSLEKELDNLNT